MVFTTLKMNQYNISQEYCQHVHMCMLAPFSSDILVLS